MIVEDFDIFGSLFSKMLPLDLFVEIKYKNGKLYVDVIINITYIYFLTGRRSLKWNKKQEINYQFLSWKSR